jgi:lipopolysaccharide export system protein LptA
MGRLGAPGWIAAFALLLASTLPALAIDPPDCPGAQKLCIEADRTGGVDMKSGSAILEGNVRGVLKEHDARFRSEVLRAFRNDKNAWVRLELDQKVELEQLDRRAKSDHAVIVNDTGEATLTGNAELWDLSTYAAGEELYLQRQPERSTLTGTPGHRAFVRREARVLSEDSPAQPNPGTGAARPAPIPSNDPHDPFWTRSPAPATPPAGAGDAPEVTPEPVYLPDTVLVWSDKAVMDRDTRRAHFTGKVEMHRKELGWKVLGDKVDLEFSEDQRLIRFDAEGNVRIEQPGRVMVADEAHSQNELETILLVGHAKVTRPGEFDLTSERMEVYTDVEQGVVQSADQQRPIRLTIDLGKAPPFKLTETALDNLRARGLPQVTLTKLEGLREKPYTSRNDFLGILRGTLTAREADLYQDVIVEAARGQLHE